MNDRKFFAGGHHARFTEKDMPMHVISKTFQGRFLLVPCDELNDLIGGVIARAKTLYGQVELHAIVFMSNHMHAIATGPADELSDFFGYIKREISRRWGRHPAVAWPGGMWGDLITTALPTVESQENALRYVLSQGVKEDLVERPEHWPGVHCAHALLGDETISGHWFDSTRFKRARQLEARKRHPEPIDRDEFTTAYTMTLSPLPAWSKLEQGERRERVRKMIDELSAQEAERRKKAGATVLGAQAVKETSRDTRIEPPKPPWFELRRRMIAWADKKCSETREYVQRYWAFQAAFRQASIEFLGGTLDAAFPLGAFRPGSWRSYVPEVVVAT